MHMYKVLLGSPIYQTPEILKLFLASLSDIQQQTFTMDYYFVDDNADPISSECLMLFKEKYVNTIIAKGSQVDSYICNENSHQWNESLMSKVANYKNGILQYAIENDYDYVFFIDSDILIKPNLIDHLLSHRKNIVSEIFWTQWSKEGPFEPNVWLSDQYNLVPKYPPNIRFNEMEAFRNSFLNQLKEPGIYKVGGLGACTLLSREALLRGVNFSGIENLSLIGEDRFFCVRAIVLGLDLFVDTYFPAYHIYRESDVDNGKKYLLP